MSKLLIITSISILIVFLYFNKTSTSLVPVETFNLKQSYSDCLTYETDNEAQGNCLRNLAASTWQKLSPTEIESELVRITDPGQLQWCHEFLHYVGWQAYEQNNNLFDTFNQSLEICDSGMYHGVAEQYIYKTSQKYSPDDFITKVVPKACEQEGEQLKLTPGMMGHCYHGLGHAFMILTSNNLAESLNFCDLVTPGFSESCYTGALMENIQTKQVSPNAKKTNTFAYDISDPNYPCSTLPLKHKTYCYRYKGVANTLLTQMDIPAAIIECQKVDKNYQSVCFWGIGTNIPGPHISTRDAAEKCNTALQLSQTAYRECIHGALGFLTQLHIGQPKELVEFCSVIDESYQNYCYSESGVQLSGWISEDETLESKCQSFANAHARQLCNTPAL